MSCNICGDSDCGMGYCERYDCDVCDDCAEANLNIESGKDDYCNCDGCYEECEHRKDCKVIKRLRGNG